jgi:hypothetical protein
MKLRSISSGPPPKCEQAMVDSVLKMDAIWRTLRNGYHSQIAKSWFRRKGRSLIEKIMTGKIDKHDDSAVRSDEPRDDQLGKVASDGSCNIDRAISISPASMISNLFWIFAVGLGAAVLLSASTATSAVQVISAGVRRSSG